MLKQTILLLAISNLTCEVANAQSTITPASRTVELRISAIGQSVKAADYVTIYVPISTNADTAEAARAANGTAITALSNALIARGVNRDAITLLPASPRLGFIGNEAYDPGDTPQLPQAMAAMVSRKSAYSIVRIRLTNAALVDGVREVLDQQNQAMVGAPLYSLNDDRAAKNDAITDAITKAKQDAEAYATPLGLRVDRITSVSNYGDATPIVPDANFFTQMMMGTREDTAKGVTTRVQVWVNFVLGPR